MNKTLIKWINKHKAKPQSKKTLVFQLFWDKEDDLIEEASQLVDKSQFVKVMRIGLRVIPALMRGDIEPLFEAFPWVKAELLEYMKEIQPSSSTERYFEEILFELRSKPMSNPKQLSPVAYSYGDDDDLEMVIEKDDSVHAGENFLSSLMNLG